MVNFFSLYFDGASKNNPGHAACAAVLYNHKHEEIDFKNVYLGDNLTNNYAEYTGLIIGLQLALKHNVTHLNVFGDSLLVINQAKKEWKILSKNLIHLYDQVQLLVPLFTNITFTHVKRELNKKADALANQKLVF